MPIIENVVIVIIIVCEELAESFEHRTNYRAVFVLDFHVFEFKSRKGKPCPNKVKSDSNTGIDAIE